MTNKTTYISALSFVLDNCDLPTEIAEKLTALRDQQVKRNSAEHKPTKTQKENEVLKDVVMAVMTTEGATVSEIMTRDERLSALSNQKVSALLNALAKEGRVLKIPDGRKTTFAVA